MERPFAVDLKGSSVPSQCAQLSENRHQSLETDSVTLVT